ncbi:MAG: hypothetical protein OEV28_04445, partial [Nitrospirota bacterium]|nr:hypothetical protein [Nitrospirota bacterium]
DLLTSRDAEVQAVMGDTDPDAVPNLGLLIDESLEVPNSGSAQKNTGTDKLEKGLLDNAKRLRTVQRVTRLVDTMTDAHDKFAIAEHADEVCRLPAKGYGTTEFGMDDNRLQALIEGGRTAMTSYLATHEAAIEKKMSIHA